MAFSGDRQRIDQNVLEAWNRSYLKQLPDDIRDLLLGEAVTVTIPAGNTIYAAYGTARFGLIQRGRARVQALSEDGREVTLRYAGPGQIVGLPSTLASKSPVGAESVTDCEVSFLNVQTVLRLAKTRPEMGDLLLREVTAILFEVIELLTDNVFGSVLQRVSRHVLDLAVLTDEGLVVQADQHSIAESVGSVREVVARALRKLREEGILVRGAKGMVIVDRERLIELSRSH
ncbi:Crp/Fnr family transcriptional regulator [Arthrobacter sp. RHLT1-20]